MTELKLLLPKIVKILRELKSEGVIHNYVLIGGMAIAARGLPRATKDLDFLVSSDEALFEKKLVLRLKSYGFDAQLYKGDSADPLRALLRISDKNRLPVIDLVLVHWKWQEEIIDNGENILIDNVAIPIAKAEDLIILKLKAGNARDILDAEELAKILSISKNKDEQRLFSLAKRAGVEKKLKQLWTRLINGK